jgi:hypothetical protein
MITLQQFRQLVPNTKYPQQWYDTLFGKQTELGGKTLLDEYEINTPKRIAAFMAQCGHESGGFVFLSEKPQQLPTPETLRRLPTASTPTGWVMETKRPGKGSGTVAEV